MEIVQVGSFEPLPLLSLNHVSLLCRSVWDSVTFYEQVLGFVFTKRPSALNFNGAWLSNYGIGIHLIENPSMDDFDGYMNQLRPINPKDNHISFQCTDVGLVKRRLEDMGMRYETGVIEDGGLKVDQVFFHDPDGYMIELCNCESIPMNPGVERLKKATSKCGFLETVMMESLSMDMMNFSF